MKYFQNPNDVNDVRELEEGEISNWEEVDKKTFTAAAKASDKADADAQEKADEAVASWFPAYREAFIAVGTGSATKEQAEMVLDPASSFAAAAK